MTTWGEQSSQNGQLLKAFGVRRLVAALAVKPVSDFDYQSGDKSPHSKRPMVFGGMRSLATARFTLLLLSLAWFAPHLLCQVVVSTTVPQSSLDQRWQWGLKEA